ncbi:uncharacterized protein LOC131616869 [Vicia villosa]|uniref:uncharacterized protein LOC131616869 n=1 Tax=Vicia villosa TaxID=3911 RepID=UPI00273B9095|nr:uncharacterized protein LOC131616869 [Vicia villosa]XP_058744312.1 uncharacterized protein LOC131616869 [Vicia villosa]
MYLLIFFFRENFARGKEMESYLEVEKLGFEMWQNMSQQDKFPFVSHAKILDCCHRKRLKREANQSIEMNIGAKSPLVENFKKPQGTLANPLETLKHKFIYTDHGVYYAGYLVVNYHKLGICSGELSY